MQTHIYCVPKEVSLAVPDNRVCVL